MQSVAKDGVFSSVKVRDHADLKSGTNREKREQKNIMKNIIERKLENSVVCFPDEGPVGLQFFSCSCGHGSIKHMQ